ncbi:unnamed protein product [Camellia sinensis]
MPRMNSNLSCVEMSVLPPLVFILITMQSPKTKPTKHKSCMCCLEKRETEKKSKETEEHPPVTVDTCPRQLSSERALALLPPARVLTLPSPTVQGNNFLCPEDAPSKSPQRKLLASIF